MFPLLASLISAGLPLIAGAFASKGKELVQEKLGINLDDALGTEAGRLQLKQLELQHEEWLVNAAITKREQDIKEGSMYLADTASARDREVKIATSAEAPLINKIITPLLASSVLVLTFALFAAVMFGTAAIDASREKIIIYILGVLSAISTQIVGYYFGSSKGSAMKDDTINMMQQGSK